MNDLSICSQHVDEAVNDIESIKKRLKIEVEKLVRASGNDYKECRSAIVELLSELKEIPMNVGNLRLTRIGKIMTKYEKELPGDLAKMANQINENWKEILRKYRQEVKNNLAKKDNVVLKEKEDANNHVADVNLNGSCSFIQVNNPETRKEEIQDRPKKVDMNTVSQRNHARSVSTKFMHDIYNFVCNTIQKVGRIETECFEIKASMVEMQQNLLAFEKHVKFSYDASSISTNERAADCHMQGNLNLDLRSIEKQLHIDKQNHKPVVESVVLTSDTDDELVENASDESENILGNNNTDNNASNITSPGHLKFTNANETPQMVRLNQRTSDVTKDANNAVISNHKTSKVEDSFDSIFDNIEIIPCQFATPPQQTNTDESRDRNEYIKTSSCPKDQAVTSTKNLKRKLSVERPLFSIGTNDPKLPPLPERVSKETVHNKKMMYTDPKPLPGSSKNPFQPLTSCTSPKKHHLGNESVLKKASYGMESTQWSGNSEVNKKDSDGFKLPKTFKCSVSVKDIHSSFVIKGEPVSDEDALVYMKDVQLDDFLSYSQAVDDMDDELDDSERAYLLHNKSKRRSSWNQFCKNTQGVQFAPLVKSNGRMKAAHKTDVGKKGIHNLLKKR